jgi:hypothetical protein
MVAVENVHLLSGIVPDDAHVERGHDGDTDK